MQILIFANANTKQYFIFVKRTIFQNCRDRRPRRSVTIGIGKYHFLSNEKTNRVTRHGDGFLSSRQENDQGERQDREPSPVLRELIKGDID